MKALGRGLGDVDPIEIEIVSIVTGAPSVELTGCAAVVAQELQISSWHITMCHEGGWAVAIAVAVVGPMKRADQINRADERGKL